MNQWSRRTDGLYIPPDFFGLKLHVSWVDCGKKTDNSGDDHAGDIQLFPTAVRTASGYEGILSASKGTPKVDATKVGLFSKMLCIFLQAEPDCVSFVSFLAISIQCMCIFE
jgi:hypothetical protein